MMKKGLLILFVALLLAGCGGKGNKVTKTCSLEEDGMSAVLDMGADGDTITKVSLNLGVTYEALDIEKSNIEKSDQTKELFLETMKELLLEEMDMSEDEGYEVDAKLGEKGFEMEVSAEASLFEQTFDATSLNEMVKSLEDEGFTCK